MLRIFTTSLIISFLLALNGPAFISSVSAAEAIPVVTALPKQTTIAETLNLSGSLTAKRQAMLSSRADGLVSAVLVDAGSSVNKGDILLILDPAIAQLEFAQAQAATNQAKAARDEAARLVQEAQRLRKQNHISESELANRQSNLALSTAALKAAEATQSAAKEQLERHDLPAPFSGVISAKMTEAGEWVNRGDPVLELVETEAVRLDVMAPQERFADIHPDTAVDVIPDANPGTILPGKITALVPVSDPQARAFLVRVEVTSTDNSLLPGTSATARFHLSSGRNRLLVPRDALLHHPDGGYSLFVVNDGIAHRRQITIGKEVPEGIVVLSGLDAGEAVVIRGNEVLRDQQAVAVVNDKP